MIDKNIQQELRAKYNPDGSELRNHQLRLLAILNRFDSICKENGINYWLSSGTCLGAIRHNGFIPWDDDIDVEMLREDYLKFLNVFNEDDSYVLQTYDNELFYTEPFPKLRMKNGPIVSEGEFDKKYSLRGVFIDIFILESSPRWAAKLCHLFYGSMRHYSLIIQDGKLSVFILKIWKNFNVALTKLLRNLFKERSEVLRHTYGTGLVDNVRMYSEIFPLSEASFEGQQFPVPSNYHSYLKRIFGDYMTIPQKKHTHNLIPGNKNENKH